MPLSTCSMASSILASATPESPVAVAPRLRSGRERALRGLLHNRAALVGIAIVAVYVFLGIAVEWLPVRSPTQIVPNSRMVGPSLALPFGGDTLGRDLLSRILFGAQLSLRVAVASVGAATVVGSLIGLVSGYVGGWLDQVLMRLMDVFFSF